MWVGGGAGKKAWGSLSRNSGQMAPGLKWYLRPGRATSRGPGTAMYQVTSLASLGYCPDGVPNPSPQLPSVLTQQLMWAAAIFADVRQQLLFDMDVRGKDIKGNLSLAA